MELIGVEELDFESNFIEVLFDGMLKEGFYVETEFDYDKEITEAEEDLGIKAGIDPINITFWEFKIFNSENEKISINDRETKKIKDLIENKLIDSLKDYLNN